MNERIRIAPFNSSKDRLDWDWNRMAGACKHRANIKVRACDVCFNDAWHDWKMACSTERLARRMAIREAA